MRHILLSISASFCSLIIFSQGIGSDITTPKSSSFNSGQSIEGHMENSVNQVTGKVAFNVPIASISSGSANFSVSFGYNGESGFEQIKKLPKYSPSGILGSGWSFSTPRIIADHKNTKTREDDTFYLFDGVSSTKLLNIGKQGTLWYFKTEVYRPIQITYNSSTNEWKVVDENGMIYSYSDKSYLSTWGNWIGSTNQLPNGSVAIEWRLSTIQDQWSNNSIGFIYELVEGKNNVNQTIYLHTEAAYLKEINSSRGGKIVFNYGNKNVQEYHEPYTEVSQHDAYQEQYETKYLNNVEIFDRSNAFIYRYDLNYEIIINPNDRKRLLTKITQKNAQLEAMPSQEFEYFTTGTFKGGLKKVIYPSGGSVTYQYENKQLFYNGSTTTSGIQGYEFMGAYASDNYALKLYKSVQLYSGNKRRLILKRYVWTGQSFIEQNSYNFNNELFKMDQNDNPENLHSVFSDDFYGVLSYENSNAKLYLFHLKRDGKTWDTYTHSVNIGSGNPSFLSGNEFVSIGTDNTGKLYNYFWDGEGWRYKMIDQGAGKYHYGATNNFIISLNRDGLGDFVTGSTSNQKNYYYIHYLDIEKKWVSKSWISFLYGTINRVQGPSYFYPDNSLSAFVAANNPEYFLRWDENYNLTNAYDVIGAHDDSYPLLPVMSSMFTLTHPWAGVKRPYLSARFNGNTWSVKNIRDNVPTNTSYSTTLGVDIVLTHDSDCQSCQKRFYYKKYNPNTNSWSHFDLANFNLNHHSGQLAGLTSDFAVVGNNVYTLHPNGNGQLISHSFVEPNRESFFVYSNHRNHVLVSLLNQNNTLYGSRLFYKNHESGAIQSSFLSNRYYLGGVIGGSFGGFNPVMSGKSLWMRNNLWDTNFWSYLYRLIDYHGSINQYVYSHVVGKIIVDNNEGDLREIEYTYSNPNSTPDNSTTLFGEVITKNKGTGSGNIGYIKSYYDTGIEDIRMAGALKKQETYDSQNNLKSVTINNWQLFLTNSYYNGQYHVSPSYYLKLMNSTSKELFENNTEIVNTKVLTYNNLGLLTNQVTTNSSGHSEEVLYSYAYQTYPNLLNNNIITAPYEISKKINGTVVSTQRTIWDVLSTSNAVYPKENLVKSYSTSFRLINQISQIDSNGNVLEVNNGNSLYSTILFSNNHRNPVAKIENATYSEVLSELDINYPTLQNLSNSQLKIELFKLYDRLPNAMISLKFYDAQDRVVNAVDNRKQEVFYVYDSFGRLLMTKDKDGNILSKKEYNFANN